MTQDLKKEFFAYRNGIIAEQLRAAGDPHTMIMGCQLADIIAIASHYNKDAQLAQSLWDDEQHRECRLFSDDRKRQQLSRYYLFKI